MSIRVIIPDTHGCEIDLGWRRAFLADLKRLDPTEIVMLGDHMEAGAWLSKHPINALCELKYSYARDKKAVNLFLDDIQSTAPRAVIHMLEGNHEAHIERFVVNIPSLRKRMDAKAILEAIGPEATMDLTRRGIHYYKRFKRYHGLAAPNTIKLGKCAFTHGWSTAKHATAVHVEMCAMNVVHGHTHRKQSYTIRTFKNEAISGFCPGTGAKLQPAYAHSTPTKWTHGYDFQYVAKSGMFLHQQVSIIRGVSMLEATRGS